MTRATICRLATMVIVAGALYAPATAAWAQASPKAPPAGLGVRLLQGPASGLDDPRAHEYIVDHVAPGTSLSRQIGFSNGDAEPIDLTFYADAATIHDGAFKPASGHGANDLTSWTSFSPTAATVEPGQTVPVTVTIAVPADATSGERYAAALAERVAVRAGGMTSISRVGIRIYLSVGPGGAPATTFTIDSMTAQRDAGGAPLVTASIHNTGQRAVDLSGRLELTNGPSSLSAGPFPIRTVATLAPGDSGTVSVPLDRGLPSGPWDAKITLVSGPTSETGTARLTFPAADGGRGSPTAIVRTDVGGGQRTALLGIAAAAAGILLLTVIASRRRQDRLAVFEAPA